MTIFNAIIHSPLFLFVVLCDKDLFQTGLCSELDSCAAESLDAIMNDLLPSIG